MVQCVCCCEVWLTGVKSVFFPSIKHILAPSFLAAVFIFCLDGNVLSMWVHAWLCRGVFDLKGSTVVIIYLDVVVCCSKIVLYS